MQTHDQIQIEDSTRTKYMSFKHALTVARHIESGKRVSCFCTQMYTNTG